MPVGVRTVRLGRLRALGLMTNLQETVGDLLETVGGGVVGGERRPRPFNLEIPVRGDGTDGDGTTQRLSGERLRRQVRSLMDNQRMKLSGLYFHSLGDHELAGWLVVGGGGIEPSGQAASARGEWKLVIQDCFKVGSPHTHMDARRIEILDRGLPTTPRDHRGQVYSTDFGGQGAYTQAFLPPGYRIATGMMGLLSVKALPSMEGDLGIVESPEDGEVLMYEQREGLRNHADVILHDRRGIPTISPTVRTNLEGNPSFEENATGYTTSGTNTISRVFGPAWNARSGHWGLKITYGNTLNLLQRARTFSGAGTYTVSCWVKIPREWDGGSVLIDASAYAGSSGESQFPTNMSIRDTWQRISCTVTVAGGDLVGSFDLLASSAPTVGRYILVDDFQVEAGATATAYFDGDSRFCRWQSIVHGSPSESYGDPEDFGWEEIFGENWAIYDHADPPVMSNSICRIRREPAVTSAVGFAIDTYVQLSGWVEVGRVYMGAGTFLFTEVLGSHVVEWSPERAVVAVHLNAPATTMAGTLYITLQRGWSAPRLELYGDGVDGFLPGYLYMELVPNDTNHIAIVTGEVASTNPVGLVVTDQPGAAASLVWDPTGLDEPWVIVNPVTGGGLAWVIALTLANVNVYWEDDSVAYGSARKAIWFSNESLIAPTTYIGLQLGRTPRFPVLQAEDGTNGGGSSDVADANARGGNAVESTNVADPAGPSLTFSPSQLFDDTTVGNNVCVWVRVLVTSAGSGQWQFNYGTDATNGPKSSASTSYVWLRLDSPSRVSGQDLDIEMWRSAGAGAVRIDSVIVLPLEQRQVGGTLNGIVDFSDRCMQDTRQTPDLVSR